VWHPPFVPTGHLETQRGGSFWGTEQLQRLLQRHGYNLDFMWQISLNTILQSSKRAPQEKKQAASRVMSLPMDLCCVRNWPYKRTGRAFKTSNSSNRKCSWKRGTKWNLQSSLVSASVVSPWEMERQQKDPDIHMQFPPSESHVIIVANS
jgi:hypothetical protein